MKGFFFFYSYFRAGYTLKESTRGGSCYNITREGGETPGIYYNWENTTFVIENNKFKSLQIEKCVKCNVVLNNLISSIEIINSKKVKIQVLGKSSSISIDKCTGVEFYLSKENVECEFTTALSSEMNIHIQGQDEEWTEITIPEQFQHHLENGKLTTRVSDLYKF
ncbi:hypothetical protein PFHG_00335 [Plasmodium falciparum HB3]|uniref:C-CAP/cofactor C-like domain-containing protein n=1 Tax=Plasmodium falciparum (isolate HB3) TaxID=137071 RepID=A0A0L7K681_PLAFX|nr:hypothetical protein PFHG_00335 [Plasmodium falciparum HB3]